MKTKTRVTKQKPKKSEKEWGELLEGLAPDEASPTSSDEPVFPEPEPSKLGLTESSQRALNTARASRAMLEAFDVGEMLFSRSPEFLQKRAVDLILIMNAVSAAHPRARKKIVGRMVDGCLRAAADWVRERKK